MSPYRAHTLSLCTVARPPTEICITWGVKPNYVQPLHLTVISAGRHKVLLLQDCSPKEVKENVFKLKSLSSVCVRGEMAAETREESQKLTSSTFGEEEGYCQTIWAKGVEETSAVGQCELSSVSNHTRENETSE